MGWQVEYSRSCVLDFEDMGGWKHLQFVVLSRSGYSPKVETGERDRGCMYMDCQNVTNGEKTRRECRCVSNKEEINRAREANRRMSSCPRCDEEGGREREGERGRDLGGILGVLVTIDWGLRGEG